MFQSDKIIKTEVPSSESHSPDMISPTTAIVNLVYELAQSFPGQIVLALIL